MRKGYKRGRYGKGSLTDENEWEGMVETIMSLYMP
jgi:hypothetical protein